MPEWHVFCIWDETHVNRRSWTAGVVAWLQLTESRRYCIAVTGLCMQQCLMTGWSEQKNNTSGVTNMTKGFINFFLHITLSRENITLHSNCKFWRLRTDRNGIYDTCTRQPKSKRHCSLFRTYTSYSKCPKLQHWTEHWEGYGLDAPGFDPLQGGGEGENSVFCKTCETPLGPTYLPKQRVLGAVWQVVKRCEREVGHASFLVPKVR